MASAPRLSARPTAPGEHQGWPAALVTAVLLLCGLLWLPAAMGGGAPAFISGDAALTEPGEAGAPAALSWSSRVLGMQAPMSLCKGDDHDDDSAPPAVPLRQTAFATVGGLLAHRPVSMDQPPRPGPLRGAPQSPRAPPDPA